MSDNETEDKAKGFHWSNQSKLIVMRAEEIMKKFLPCPADKVIAEIQYDTGLSNKRVKEIVSMFVKREVVQFKEMKYNNEIKRCMVFTNA